MSEVKSYKKSYVFGLNQQIQMLRKGLKIHKQLCLLQEEKIRMLNVNFKGQNPSIISSDIQTFILGYHAAEETVQKQLYEQEIYMNNYLFNH